MIIFLLLVLTVFLGIGNNESFADNIITFGPRETKIDGSIPYSVVGKYKAQFKVFKGEIRFDRDQQKILSVYLAIKVNSIASNCPWCDNIVRSGRLLNTRRFPNIIFQSDKIIHDDEGYKVKGVLEMHGIKRVMIFPFMFSMTDGFLDLQGSWIINRKDFDIYWNRVLDHGGVLVGDNMTVNWGIRENLKRREL